jgi:dehydrogenase/reductase SDR family member 7B
MRIIGINLEKRVATMKNNKFRNKTIWITGASSGIGEEFAVAFAREGARLVVSGRDTAALERVADRCCAAGATVRPFIEPFDISDHSHFPAIVEQVLDRTGGIDILVNNAGVGQRATALSCKPDVVRKIMDVNFLGPVFLTQAILPSMIKCGSGRIVVVSSVLGKFHLPGRSAYAASKHALQGYFTTLRTELHGSGIAVTIISPGWIATNISRNALTASGKPYEQATRAHGSRMSAEECARQALRAIASGKDEALVGGKEIWGAWTSVFFPRIYEWFVRRNKEFIISST